jgi:cyanophycin synthetase
MIMLGDFVDQTGDALESTNDLGRISRIGVIATAGDRRNDDMRTWTSSSSAFRRADCA